MAVPAVAAAAPALRTLAMQGLEVAKKYAPQAIRYVQSSMKNANGLPVVNNEAQISKLVKGSDKGAVAVLEHLVRGGVNPTLISQNVSPEFLNNAEVQNLMSSLNRVYGNVAERANSNAGVGGSDLESQMAATEMIKRALSVLGISDPRDLWELIKSFRTLSEADCERFFLQRRQYRGY